MHNNNAEWEKIVEKMRLQCQSHQLRIRHALHFLHQRHRQPIFASRPWHTLNCDSPILLYQSHLLASDQARAFPNLLRKRSPYALFRFAKCSNWFLPCLPHCLFSMLGGFVRFWEVCSFDCDDGGKLCLGLNSLFHCENCIINSEYRCLFGVH